MDWLFGPSYKVWLINTTDNIEIYRHDEFKTIEPNLNSLIDLCSNPTYLRTFQSLEFEHSWLGFGRMKWSKENNIKWTTKYLENLETKDRVRFFNTEIWSPDWNICLNSDKSPDLFINIYRTSYENIRDGILIAISLKMTQKHDDLINKNINEINSKIKGSTISFIQRRWKPDKGFVNRIEDMNEHELAKLLNQKGSA